VRRGAVPVSPERNPGGGKKGIKMKTTLKKEEKIIRYSGRVQTFPIGTEIELKNNATENFEAGIDCCICHNSKNSTCFLCGKQR